MLNLTLHKCSAPEVKICAGSIMLDLSRNNNWLMCVYSLDQKSNILLLKRPVKDQTKI